MNFAVTVNIPDYALWGGLAALAPVGVLIVLQLLFQHSAAMSAMSLGGSVRFEARVWVVGNLRARDLRGRRADYCGISRVVGGRYHRIADCRRPLCRCSAW